MKLSMLAWSVALLQLRAPETDGGAGGAGGEAGGTGGGDPEGGDKAVPLKTHKELLDKFHNTNNQLKTMQTEMEKLKNDLKSKQTKSSEDNGDFKNLYEQTKAEKEQAEGKLDNFKKAVFNNERMRALETELKSMGMKAGNESVVDFANLEEMPTEQTSMGRILVHGVKEQAAKLKEKYSFAFDKPQTPNINNGGAGGGSGTGGSEEGSDISDDKLTPQFMVELQKKDPAKYKAVYGRFAKKMQTERQK